MRCCYVALQGHIHLELGLAMSCFALELIGQNTGSTTGSHPRRCGGAEHIASRWPYGHNDEISPRGA